MGCISSAPVEPEVDEFEGDPLADLKRRKRDLETEVKGAEEYGQALLASQTELLQAPCSKERVETDCVPFKSLQEVLLLWGLLFQQHPCNQFPRLVCVCRCSGCGGWGRAYHACKHPARQSTRLSAGAS